jgi:3-oxoacyl-[acyl-carrier protein] reductase
LGRLQNQTALVTGGNTGIGRAVCEAFSREGANLVIGYYAHADNALELAQALTDQGVRAIAVEVDVTDEVAVDRLFASALEAFSRVDILVNNAGIQKSQPISDTSVDDWDMMMNVHLRGAFLCSRAASKVMKEQGSGRIINVCSQLGYIGRANYTAYSAAKGGVIAFTRALARELAPDGINVNGVAPGLVDTGFDPLSEEAKSEHATNLPLQRLGTPEDMVSAFVFLASDEARYYCGQLLHPNGGEIMP